MADRLENLRLFFPAEVTAGYVGIQGLLLKNQIPANEYMWTMVWVAIGLAALNALIYLKYYEVKGRLWLSVVTIGFFIWVLNVDIQRFKDLPVLGSYIPIGVTAPALLIFYTLMTMFFDIPRRKADAT